MIRFETPAVTRSGASMSAGLKLRETYLATRKVNSRTARTAGTMSQANGYSRPAGYEYCVLSCGSIRAGGTVAQRKPRALATATATAKAFSLASGVILHLGRTAADVCKAALRHTSVERAWMLRVVLIR